MSKKVITLLCVIALLVTAVCVYAAADAASAVATIGTQYFDTLEEAVEAVDAENPEQYVITLRKDVAAAEVDKTVYLDLAGKNIASVNVAKDVTLYCLDSETDDYAIEGDEETGYTGFGRIAAVTGEGEVAGVEAGMIPVEASQEYVNGCLDGYLMVEEGAGLSFHRANLQIKAMTLRAKEEGATEVNPSVYYRSAFAGDALVAKQVKTFGIALSVQEEPNEDNMGLTNAYSWFDGTNFTAGENNNDATSTLLRGIMKESNAKLANNSNANMPVMGRAYIQLDNGDYIFGITASRTLREQAEGVAAIWDDLVDEKKKPVMEMYDTYRSVMQQWNVKCIADEPRNYAAILGIGNSYTVDSMRMLAEIYMAEGNDKDLTLGIAYNGGCLLGEHYGYITENSPAYTYYTLGKDGKWVTEKNVTLRYILEQQEWDLVSMQQGSAHSGLLSSYKDTYIDGIQSFVERILGYTPTYMWNMTWAWPVEDCDGDGDTAIESNSSYRNYYSSSQETMYEMILDCVQQKIVTDPKFEYLMPVGTAIQNARTSYLTDKDLHRDDSHVNDLGRLLAGYVWYCEIEGVTLDEIQLRVVPERLTYSYKGGDMLISESIAKVIAESVKNAMSNKFEVTQSQYPENVLDGKKIIFFGNSYTYYGKCVLDKGQNVYSQEERMNDEGYFYQICKANGIDVNVTNFTFGSHYLKDFHPTGCAADRGHDGLNHLSYITDFNYDYVVLQTGSAPLNYENLLAECEPIMQPFREANPNVKFIFLANHIEFLIKDTELFKDTYVWRSDIKKLAEAGITVVDWGTLVCDLMYGRTTIPGGTQDCNINTFIISQSETDGHHQNMLTGYITAQMTYCAITGESAQGQIWSFEDHSAFTADAISTYRTKYYKIDTETNFDTILNSAADMAGIQRLIDQYLAAKTYLNY